jgi:tetratricopeptide (TPR) repeat protein
MEKALGPDHPDVAMSLNNIASHYSMHGDYTKAEPLYKRALSIWEKAFGPDHPDMATCLENVADLYRNTERVAEAEQLEERAAKIRATKR